MPKRLLRALRHNWSMKLLAVGIAVALFFLVRSDSIKELEVEVPVALSGQQLDVVLTGDVPSSIRVRLRGRWSRLLRVLESKPLPYELSLGQLANGELHSFDEGRLRQLIGAEGLDFANIEPGGVLVRFESRVSDLVPVKLDFVGDPADGYAYEITEALWDPTFVKATGPKSAVEALTAAHTAPILLTGLTRNLDASIALLRPDRAHVTFEPDRIAVKLPIHERVVEDELVAVRIYVLNCSPHARCLTNPNRVRVTARGPLRRLRELKELGVEQMVWVDVADFGEEQGSHDGVPVHTKRFESIEFEVDPPVVSVDVQALPTPLPIVLPLPEPSPAPAPSEGGEGAGESGEGESGEGESGEGESGEGESGHAVPGEAGEGAADEGGSAAEERPTEGHVVKDHAEDNHPKDDL